MRRKLLILASALVAVVAAAGWSWAGDYHSDQNLICSDCHVMHYSQQHGYNPNLSNGGNFAIPANGPSAYLLRNNINELCLSCHDGLTWAPDVFEINTNAYVRQAGALNELGGSAQYPEITGHTLGSTDDAPGSNPPWNNPTGLECTDCHSEHGEVSSGIAAPGGYRNLFRDISGFTSITYSRADVEGSNDLNKWVFEDASAGVSASHFGRDHITFDEPDQNLSRYADFCKSCHTDFHGTVGGMELGGIGSPATEFIRHPTAGVNIGAVGDGVHSDLTQFVNEGADQLQVLSPTGVRAGSYTGSNADLTPSCMTCHKGHGNKNAFGLVYMIGAGAITEEGDNGTDIRNTCRACHIQGGPGTNPW
jgi:hypothetical protein